MANPSRELVPITGAMPTHVLIKVLLASYY
jgi:hypothetical protein